MNQRLNGGWVRPRIVGYGGNWFVRAFNYLNDNTRDIYPDSRPLLEQLGIAIIGETHEGGMWKCRVPDYIIDQREADGLDGDMSRLRLTDARTGKLVVDQFLKVEGSLKRLESALLGLRTEIPEEDQWAVRECNLSMDMR